MSLTKQKRLEQKKAAILEEAKKVLIRNGKKATMGDIAAALDMDKSSLYYYYKGIPEILNTILDKEYYDFDTHFKKLTSKNRKHLEVLAEMVSFLLEFYYDNLEFLQIILSQIFPLFQDPEIKEETKAINNYMESYRLANDYMLTEIDLARKSGEISSEFTSEMILQTLRGAVFGVCAVWKQKKDERSRIPLIAQRVIRMYLG
jgi:AcrR family transcriptional regulator